MRSQASRAKSKGLLAFCLVQYAVTVYPFLSHIGTGVQVLSVVASQVKCIQDAVTRFSNPDLREPQYQHLPAGIPNVKVSPLVAR